MDIGPLEPSKAQLLVGLLAFFLIFVTLGRLLLPRAERVLAERYEATEGKLEKAEALRAEAEQVYAEYRHVITEAHHEAARLRQQAAEEGAAAVAAARAEGQRERERLVGSARASIAMDADLAALELRVHVGVLAIDLAGRVVGEPLEGFSDRAGVVERFFAEPR
ncbi:F0F1 ATP synthase subunit B family protein [Kitasatospora sp. NPDC004289]